MKVAAAILGAIAAILILLQVGSARPYWRAANASRIIQEELSQNHMGPRGGYTDSEQSVALQQALDELWAIRSNRYDIIVGASLFSMLLSAPLIIFGLIKLRKGGGTIAGIGLLLLVCGAASMSFQEFDWHPAALYVIVGGSVLVFAFAYRSAKAKAAMAAAT